MMYHPRFTKIELEVGKHYLVSHVGKPALCKFIRVTPKGFNFLMVEKDRCLLKRHLYALDMGGKPITKTKHSFLIVKDALTIVPL